MPRLAMHTLQKSSARFASFVILTLSLSLVMIVPGCSKPPPLQRTVKAGDAGELADFRTKLQADWDAESMRVFDIAIQELKTDAMNRGVAGAQAREDLVLRTIAGKQVRQVLISGWQARFRRTAAELKDMSARLAHDSQLLQKPGSTDSSRHLNNLTQNERDLVAQLERQLSSTAEKLKSWGSEPERPEPLSAPK